MSYSEQRVLHVQNRKAQREEEEKADFEHWGKAPYWTEEEAVALSLGKEPKVINLKTIQSRYGTSSFAEKYRQTFELVTRALRINELPSLLPPMTFLEWADRKRIRPPEELVQSVKKHSAVMKNWPDTLTSIEPGKPALEQSSYWIEFAGRAEQAVTEYPKWRQTQYKIQKAANLHEWLQNNIGANTREAEIIKKIMTDIFQELK